MKLIPRARPVRIRIMSGGMEHSNLKSLSEHFSAKDVMESISNGCMVRWLLQCGEREIAESIESASGKGTIEILKALNPEWRKIKSNIDIVIDLYSKGQKENALYLFDKDLSDDVDAIKNAWDNKIADIDFHKLFAKYWKTDAEIAFIYAKARVDNIFNKQDRYLTKRILESAIQRGHLQAKAYQESDIWKHFANTSDIRFSDVDTQKMKNVVLSIFTGRTNSSRNLNNNEKNIVKLAEFCREICRKTKFYPYESIMWDFAQFTKKQEEINSSLIPEIKLLQVMFNECHQKDGWELLRSIQPETPVIKLYKEQYYIMQNKCLHDNYRFVLQHLFDEYQ